MSQFNIKMFDNVKYYVIHNCSFYDSQMDFTKEINSVFIEFSSVFCVELLGNHIIFVLNDRSTISSIYETSEIAFEDFNRLVE